MQSLPAVIALVFPLIGSGLIALSGSALGERVARIGIWAVAISAGSALLSLYQAVQAEPVLLIVPGLPDIVAPRLLVDRLAGVMMMLITGVSLVIHVYSRRYMQGDSGYTRFFALLGLLTFVLLSLVTTGHLLWLFVAWHGVTWLLSILISFNHASPTARKAGRTAFRVQSLGDAALLIGILLVYAAFGTFDLSSLFMQLAATTAPPTFGAGTWWEIDAASLITLLLVLSIMTKSAQFPFHVWLPGTIEAPTPVSAMLHAGIVNAGGFLVNRLAPLYGSTPTTLYILFIVGALTGLIGASTMLTQPSIKRTLVYSTMGQMGYMIMECGLGAFALAIFHLCAHGVFKATLFLNSGANIHKARAEFKLPSQHPHGETAGFAFMPWATGLAITLIVPLIILLIAHGAVSIPLFEAQGTMIFLFFAWVTSAQAVFSLYRLNAVASWKVSVTMLATLAFIGLTYLWAAESFTHFLYPSPAQAAAYFQAAAWNQGLFDAFVAVSAMMIVGVWVILYRKAHRMRLLLPGWLEQWHARLYVTFLNGFYVEDVLRALSPFTGRESSRYPRHIQS
jgi:NADH-quinone oxidoreductase subunit L